MYIYIVLVQFSFFLLLIFSYFLPLISISRTLINSKLQFAILHCIRLNSYKEMKEYKIKFSSQLFLVKHSESYATQRNALSFVSALAVLPL